MNYIRFISYLFRMHIQFCILTRLKKRLKIWLKEMYLQYLGDFSQHNSVFLQCWRCRWCAPCCSSSTSAPSSTSAWEGDTPSPGFLVQTFADFPHFFEGEGDFTEYFFYFHEIFFDFTLFFFGFYTFFLWNFREVSKN